MLKRVGLDRLADVNRWLGRDWPGTDFIEAMQNPLNVILACGEGGAAFAWRGPNTYEVHVFFEQRGREVLDISHAMLAMMRRDYGAKRFWALVPDEARKVKIFTRLMGWKSQGHLQTQHGPNELFVSEICSCPLS